MNKIEVVPRDTASGATVFDLRCVSKNGRVLWYSNQGYGSTKDADRAIVAIRAATATAVTKYIPLAPDFSRVDLGAVGK